MHQPLTHLCSHSGWCESLLTVPSSGMDELGKAGAVECCVTEIWAPPSGEWHQPYDTNQLLDSLHIPQLCRSFSCTWGWAGSGIWKCWAEGQHSPSLAGEGCWIYIPTRTLWWEGTFYTDKSSQTGSHSADNIFPKPLDNLSFFFLHHLVDR